MVKAVFTGTDRSCGLRKGSIYFVCVKGKYDRWYVDVLGISIPYRSFYSMIENWRFL